LTLLKKIQNQDIRDGMKFGTHVHAKDVFVFHYSCSNAIDLDMFKKDDNRQDEMRSFKGSKLLLSMILVSFLLILSSGVTRALRPLYFVEVGANQVQLGILMALPSLIMLLIRVPASTLLYRLGRWRMMFFSIALSVITTALFAFIYEPVLFFPLVSAAALPWAIYSPIAVEYVSSQSTSTTRGSTMGLYFTSIAAAIFVGPLIASIITAILNLRQLFLLSSVFPVVSIAVFLAIVKPSEMTEYELKNANGGGYSGNIKVSLVRIFRNRNFISISVARIAWSIAMGIFSAVYPVYAGTDLGLSPSLISFLFTARGVTNMVVRMPAGRLSDRIGRRRPFILAYVAAIIVYALLAYVRDFTVLILVMAVYGVGWGMRVAPSMALVSESFNDEDRPLALSLFMTMFDIGAMIGSLLVGFVGGILSSQMLLLLCSPIMAGALIVFTLFSKEVTRSDF
jgi:MFS family permease